MKKFQDLEPREEAHEGDCHGCGESEELTGFLKKGRGFFRGSLRDDDGVDNCIQNAI